MKIFLSIVIAFLASANLSQAQGMGSRDTRWNMKDLEKRSVEDGKIFRGKSFSGEKRYDAGSLKFESFLTRDFEGGKKAISIQDFKTEEYVSGREEAQFVSSNKDEIDKAFDEAEKKAREQGGIYAGASSKYDKSSQEYDSPKYEGPEVGKINRSLRNLGRPNLTVDEVRDLLNSPGSSRKDISGER